MTRKQLQKYETLCAASANESMLLAKVQLYCNPATSEVAGEHTTLHDALAAATPSAHGALLICDGKILASAVSRGWLLDQAGIERLCHEFNALLGGCK